MRIIKFILVIIISIFLLHCENVNLGEMYKISDYYTENQKWTPVCSKIAFINPTYYENGPALCYIDPDGNSFSVIDMNGSYFDNFGQFCFIDDGNYIVFYASKDKSLPPYIPYKIPSEGGTPVKLFDDNQYEWNGFPTSSDDGWIYLLRSNDSWIYNVWKVKSDGSELTDVGIKLEMSISSFQCSKDGRYLVFDFRNTKNNIEMKVIRLSDKKMWSVADSSNFSNVPSGKYQTFSPDSKWICFCYHSNNEGGLYIVPFDNSDDPVKVADCGGPSGAPYYPDWSSDGKWIIFGYYSFLYKLKVPDEFLPE
jgi:Tol biopolymer transport system component